MVAIPPQVTGQQSGGGCKRDCFSDGLQHRKQFKMTLPVESRPKASSVSGASGRPELGCWAPRCQTFASTPLLLGTTCFLPFKRFLSLHIWPLGTGLSGGQCVPLCDNCSRHRQAPGVPVSRWQPWPATPQGPAVRAGLQSGPSQTQAPHCVCSPLLLSPSCWLRNLHINAQSLFTLTVHIAAQFLSPDGTWLADMP